MTDKRIVLSTAGSKEEAQRIAQALVEERLAACVNVVGPIHSVYWWRGEVESGEEFLMLIKTTAAASAQVRDSLKRLHSYELPECLEVTPTGGSAEYLAWIGENVFLVQ